MLHGSVLILSVPSVFGVFGESEIDLENLVSAPVLFYAGKEGAEKIQKSEVQNVEYGSAFALSCSMIEC